MLFLFASTLLSLTPMTGAGDHTLGDPQMTVVAQVSGTFTAPRPTRAGETVVWLDLQVWRSWRGWAPSSMRVAAGSRDAECEADFIPGFDYLLPVYWEEDVGWHLGTCAGVRPWGHRSGVQGLGFGRPPYPAPWASGPSYSRPPGYAFLPSILLTLILLLVVMVDVRHLAVGSDST